MAHRRLTDHIVSPSDLLVVEVQDEPGAGGANHRYHIYGYDAINHPERWVGEAADSVTLLFQNGPTSEVGVNGVTHEALLAILIDRIAAFEAGPYACPENLMALEHLRAALAALAARTRNRLARGVEGTSQV